MRNRLKESPFIILNTLEALWVILLSIVGNYIMSLKINFCWTIDWVCVCKLVSLALCVLFLGITYYRFKESYITAEKKDKENYDETKDKNNKKRRRTPFFFWRVYNVMNFLYLLFGVIFLLLFLYLNSFDKV